MLGVPRVGMRGVLEVLGAVGAGMPGVLEGLVEGVLGMRRALGGCCGWGMLGVSVSGAVCAGCCTSWFVRLSG